MAANAIRQGAETILKWPCASWPARPFESLRFDIRRQFHSDAHDSAIKL